MILILLVLYYLDNDKLAYDNYFNGHTKAWDTRAKTVFSGSLDTRKL